MVLKLFQIIFDPSYLQNSHNPLSKPSLINFPFIFKIGIAFLIHTEIPIYL